MRILLATDGSESANVAAELVGALPLTHGSRIRVVRVVEPPPTGAMTAWELVVPLDDVADDRALVADAHGDVQSIAATLRVRGFDVETGVLHGRPAEAIVADAELRMPDLVVVGNRGHSGIERMLLGSVSGEVVDHSPVPVLVGRRGTVRRVVIGVDGSAIAADAVEAVARWPILADAQITVVSVVPEPATWWPSTRGREPAALSARSREEVMASALTTHQAFADEAAARLRRSGFAPTAEVKIGAAAHVLVSTVAALDADLLIVGSHGRTGVSRWLLGSVARNVLHHATCSVLVVRRHVATRRQAEPLAGWGLIGDLAGVT